MVPKFTKKLHQLQNCAYQREEGNSTVFAIGIFAVVLAIIIVLASVFGIYLGQKKAQTAADAAALQAAKTLGIKFQAELNTMRDLVLKDFWSDVKRETNREGSENPLEAETRKEIIKTMIGQEELQEALIEGRMPSFSLLSREKKYGKFRETFNAVKLGDILYRTAREYWPSIIGSAAYMAERNGSDNQINCRFPVDGKPKILITVRKPYRLLLFRDEQGLGNKYITASSAAVIACDQLPAIDLSRRTTRHYTGFSQ